MPFYSTFMAFHLFIILSISLPYVALFQSKLFDKPKLRNEQDQNEDPLAIDHIAICSESRLLAVAGASSQVVVTRDRTRKIDLVTDCVTFTGYRVSVQQAGSRHRAPRECRTQILHNSHSFSLTHTTCIDSRGQVVEVIMKYDAPQPEDPAAEAAQGISGLLKPVGGSNDELVGDRFYPLTVKAGQHKRLPGYQPELACLSPWLDQKQQPYKITSVAIHATYNL